MRDSIISIIDREALGVNLNNYVQLRVIASADLDDVLQIEQQVGPGAWTRARFETALQAAYPGWVALLNEQIVGYAILMLTPDAGEVLILGVAKSVQRQGVAGLLFNAMQMATREAGVHRLILEVRESNHSAIAFYLAMGCRELARRKGYYSQPTEDAIVMDQIVA